MFWSHESFTNHVYTCIISMVMGTDQLHITCGYIQAKYWFPKIDQAEWFPFYQFQKKLYCIISFFTLIYIYFMYLPMYFWCIFWNWNNKLKWTELNWMIIISIIKECAQVIGPLLIMCYTHFNQASCKWVDCNQGNIPRHNPLFASLFDQSLQRFKISC